MDGQRSGNTNTLLRDKMNCTVGFVAAFYSSPSLPWQKGWYISVSLRKKFLNLTPLFILALSNTVLYC